MVIAYCGIQIIKEKFLMKTVQTKKKTRINTVFLVFMRVLLSCRWWDSNPHALADNRF